MTERDVVTIGGELGLNRRAGKRPYFTYHTTNWDVEFGLSAFETVHMALRFSGIDKSNDIEVTLSMFAITHIDARKCLANLLVRGKDVDESLGLLTF